MMDLEGLSQLCFDHACEVLRDDEGVHCETLLALLAGLAGTQIFVNESSANETEAREWGNDESPRAEAQTITNELCTLITQVVEAHLDKPARQTGAVAAEHQPAESARELVANHFESFSALLDRQKIESEERPFLFAVIAAQAIITVEDNLSIPVGLRIVNDGLRQCAAVPPVEHRRRTLS